jgi:hypothetical protein
MHTNRRLVNAFFILNIYMCALFENYAGHHKKLSALHLFSFCLTHRKLKKGSTKALYTMGHMSYYQWATTDKNKSDKHVRNRRILPNG